MIFLILVAFDTILNNNCEYDIDKIKEDTENLKDKIKIHRYFSHTNLKNLK